MRRRPGTAALTIRSCPLCRRAGVSEKVHSRDDAANPLEEKLVRRTGPEGKGAHRCGENHSDAASIRWASSSPFSREGLT